MIPKRIEFHKSGRGKAQCAPDPRFPDGIDVDISRGMTHCETSLPYPAPECGVWTIHCAECLLTVAVTAAGRPDDPRSVKIPCRKTNN